MNFDKSRLLIENIDSPRITAATHQVEALNEETDPWSDVSLISLCPLLTNKFTECRERRIRGVQCEQ